MPRNIEAAVKRQIAKTAEPHILWDSAVNKKR